MRRKYLVRLRPERCIGSWAAFQMHVHVPRGWINARFNAAHRVAAAFSCNTHMVLDHVGWAKIQAGQWTNVNRRKRAACAPRESSSFPAGNFAPREFAFLRTLNPFTSAVRTYGKYFKDPCYRVENECVFWVAHSSISYKQYSFPCIVI